MRDFKYLGHILQTEHAANCTWTSLTYQDPGVWGWMENRWVSGVLKALRQTTAEDALALCLLGIKTIPRTQKNVQEELKPTHPAVKYSLGTGENKWQQLCTAAPVKLNRMATAKERVLAQGPFVQNHHRFCHLLWHLNSCFSCIHNANPYQLSASSESTSEYFKPFKKFSSYCSIVRSLIN